MGEEGEGEGEEMGEEAVAEVVEMEGERRAVERELSQQEHVGTCERVGALCWEEGSRWKMWVRVVMRWRKGEGEERREGEGEGGGRREEEEEGEGGGRGEETLGRSEGVEGNEAGAEKEAAIALVVVVTRSTAWVCCYKRWRGRPRMPR